MKIVNKSQETQFQSPWSIRERVLMIVWEWVWSLCCTWTPKPFNTWRLCVLKAFGAKLEGVPFVHQRARIQIPWNLSMKHRACLGDRVNAYTLGVIEIGESATVAQEAYLCTGTHDFENPAMPLVVGAIRIEPQAFVGARAMVLPGVRVGAGAVVGAQAVVTKDVPNNTVVAGNPAKVIRKFGREGNL